MTKVNVFLPPDAMTSLRDLAQRRGSPMSKVIVDAIATEALISAEINKGGLILIENKDGTMSRLVFIR